MNFSADYMMKISTWEKKLPELVKDNNYKWIATNHKQVFEFIMKNYENKNTLVSWYACRRFVYKIFVDYLVVVFVLNIFTHFIDLVHRFIWKSTNYFH